MHRLSTLLAALALLVATSPAAGQVVETDPDPPRTDESVTITFNADEGTGGLANHNGEVYAHTGISTDQNPPQDWKCVKNNWPTSSDFTGNRDDTQLSKVGTNRYELQINDIRAYYQNTSTSCSLEGDEKIQTMNFVFRSADGSKEGKAEGGADIFVDVVDVSGGDPVVQAQINDPSVGPLEPFVTSTNTTVPLSLSAETASIDQFVTLNLYVNGNQVASGGFGTPSLEYDLVLDSPGHYNIEAVATANANGNTIRDTVRAVFTRTPDVVEEARPSGVEDGINYNSDGSVTLSLYAPNKDFVYAIGDFTDWQVSNDHFMKRDGDHWWLTVDGLTSGQQYDFQYFVDGEIRVADPFSKKVRTPADEFLNEEYTVYPGLESYPDRRTNGIVSVLETGQEDFNFSEFEPPPQNEMVVYELLLRDFLEQHSFAALTDTLDYLDRLGINAIELMPVSNFGSNNSWGYNPNFHLALDKSYGPPEDLKQFVEAAHNRGIAVILDVVYNHITNQSPLYQLYGSAEASPFLEANAGGICGGFFEKLNQNSPFIQNYIDRANEYWIEEFNIDGFRYDLAKCLGGEGGVKRMADHVWDNVDKDTYMILEYFAGTAEEERLANYRDDEAGIEGMIPWNKMSEEYGEAGMGYINNGGISSNIEGSYFGFAGLNDPSFMTYMESHDEQWLMHKFASFGNATAEGDYNVKELDTALNRQKLVGAFFFTVPGPRMTWQFAELGYGFQPDECLQDDGGATNCPEGAPSRTEPKPVRWEYRSPEQSPNRVRLYKTWQALLRLRNQYEVFRAPRSISNSEEAINMKASDTDYVRWIKLEDEDLDAVVVGNFDVIPRSTTVSFPQTGTWHNFFANTERQVNTAQQSFDLQPGEFRIYTSEAVAPPPPGLLSFPTVRSSAMVSSSGAVDFGETGVDVSFASGTSGSGTVTVDRFARGPFRPQGIDESTVSDFRFAIDTEDNLEVGSGTEVRLDVSTLSGVGNPSAVTVYRRPTEGTGSFTEVSTSYDAGANELVAQTASFSEFVLASNDADNPLPVEMADFEATTADGAVRLNWRTASETGNATFRVQRRTADARASEEPGRTSTWTTVGSVEGSGTTSQAQSYRFTDEDLPYEADALTYRLAQVDLDGSVHHSKALTVERAVDAVALRRTFPNPARQQVTVQYALPDAQAATLRLYNVLGRRVKTIDRPNQQGRQTVRLNVSDLTSGTYFLRLTAGETTRTRRLTVVR